MSRVVHFEIGAKDTGRVSRFYLMSSDGKCRGWGRVNRNQSGMLQPDSSAK